MGAAVAALMMATPAVAGAADDLKLPRQKVELVAPPFVHAHEQATKAGPKIVEFKLTIREKEVVIDEAGTKFHAMTFDGSMPGPMMVVHEGDYMELTLVNPATNSMPHNIDLHSATGALGGGALTHVNPGEQVVLRWKATRPGVFVYHCAPEGMIPWHVVSGMHGTVMVLPRDGLKDAEGKALHYDKIFYIGENDLYVPKDENGKYKTYETIGESYADTTEVMRKLIPTHVVFNGGVGSLTGKNAMTSNVG
jgi:nitrite reductase (NO-forming)